MIFPDLASIVEGVRQQPQKPGSFDRLYDARLLLATGSSAPRSVDFADRIQVADNNVQPLVIDLLWLELCRELFSVEPCDDILSCVIDRVAGIPAISKLLLPPSSVNEDLTAICL